MFSTKKQETKRSSRVAFQFWTLGRNLAVATFKLVQLFLQCEPHNHNDGGERRKNNKKSRLAQCTTYTILNFQLRQLRAFFCAQTRAAKFIDKRIYANNMFREEEREKNAMQNLHFSSLSVHWLLASRKKMARALASKQKWHSSSRTGFSPLASRSYSGCITL
jgi:hypothetical protein